MVRRSSKIRSLLIDEGLVSEESWESALALGSEVVETLVSRGDVDERALMDVLGRAAGVAPVDLTKCTPDPAAVECLPEATCNENGVLPLSKNGNLLTIAVSDPFNVLLFDDLKRRTGCHIRTVFAHAGMLKVALESVFQTSRQQVDSLLEEVNGEGLEVEVEEEQADDIDKGTGDDEAPAVKLANLILLKGLKEGASDIHIEPTIKCLRVRYRVDGRLKVVMTPPKGILNALVSRLKILAQLDIAERNKPQDGKFQIRYEGRGIDFRVSVLPVVGGEKVVMRILDTGSMALKLSTMGHEPKAMQDITSAIHSPYGMVLVTGPTGSGKSTTLYSCVQEVATPEVNVVTVEDPVEYQMDGIAQVPVNPKRGMTFAGALRSILRQDPDVVLVGEIRDKETAEIGVKAALTGHLVLSTLHTNDAASTITRLIDMGIDPFMVSSSLLLVCAQRLGRRVCSSCRKPLELPSKERLLSVGFIEEDIAEMTLFEANPDGCPRCSRGYKGRFALLETLPLTPRIKRMIIEGQSSAQLKAQALEEGMQTLRRVGLINASRGVTTVEEILRITLSDDAETD
ncbi:MAG: type IV pilus assembly protein PilB [Planctomycetota bacterium]|jgi:type IV pilus assembly protein PilB